LRRCYVPRTPQRGVPTKAMGMASAQSLPANVDCGGALLKTLVENSVQPVRAKPARRATLNAGRDGSKAVIY